MVKRLKERWNEVSTHSRLKAAGITRFLPLHFGRSFNTQPPEGGWAVKAFNAHDLALFQHTAA